MTDRRTHDGTVLGRRSTTASAPSSAATRAASAPSTSTSTSTASPSPNCQGSRAEGRVHVEVVGQPAEDGSPSSRRPVDPVDPEGAGLAAVAVEADQVPAAPPEPEAGDVHLPRLAPVPEGGDRGPADGLEQGREGRAGRRTSGRSTSGVASPPSGDSPPAPSFKRASRPIGSPRWTPATAKFRAACSSGSKPRSGR